jgi:hypothetical protein
MVVRTPVMFVVVVVQMKCDDGSTAGVIAPALVSIVGATAAIRERTGTRATVAQNLALPI